MTSRNHSFAEREKALHSAAEFFEQRVVPHFKQRERALDLGTGNGHTALSLAKCFREVVTIDTDTNALDTTRERALKLGVTNLNLKNMDARHLDAPDDFFDAVTCRAAIHHFADPDKVLAEVRRVLTPDGQFVLMDFCFSEEAKRQLRPISMLREPDFKRYYSFHDYCDLLDTAGFGVDFIYTYTLPRMVEEWAAVAHEGMRARIVDALLGLSSDVLQELRVVERDNKHWMTYRILEILAQRT